MKDKSMKFNELPINSVFIWGNGLYFLKLKNAIPEVGMSKQPSNCFDLQKQHYCTMTSDHICKLVKQPDDFDLGGMATPEIPVGTTVHVNPEDIKWEVKGDLISREALKEALAKEIKTNDMGLWLKILLVIDNAPTVEYTFEEAFQKTVCENKLYCPNKRPTGHWIQLKDNVNHFNCSVCDDADYYEDWVPKFCPNCGAQMLGIIANKCGSCIHDKEKWLESRTCPKCRAFDRYEPNCQADMGGGTE